VPSFIKTGLVALVCLETLEVKTLGFEAPSWDGEMDEA
jgi:DNA polymerase delta subunit 2